MIHNSSYKGMSIRIEGTSVRQFFVTVYLSSIFTWNERMSIRIKGKNSLINIFYRLWVIENTKGCTKNTLWRNGLMGFRIQMHMDLERKNPWNGVSV